MIDGTDISEEGGGIAGTSTLGENLGGPTEEYVNQDVEGINSKSEYAYDAASPTTDYPTYTLDQMLRNQALDCAIRHNSPDALASARQFYEFLKGE